LYCTWRSWDWDWEAGDPGGSGVVVAIVGKMDEIMAIWF
jgi:hypothetical protein